MTPIIETMRTLLTDGTPGRDLWIALTWATGILIASTTLALRTYHPPHRPRSPLNEAPTAPSHRVRHPHPFKQEPRHARSAMDRSERGPPDHDVRRDVVSYRSPRTAPSLVSCATRAGSGANSPRPTDSSGTR